MRRRVARALAGLLLVAAVTGLPVARADGPPMPVLLEFHKARKVAEDAARDGHYAECSEVYLRLARQATVPDQVPELLYNAGVCAGRAGNAALELALLGELIDKQTMSRLRPPALLRKAQLLDRMGRQAEAAAEYVRFSKQYAAEKDGADASWNAVMLMLALGDRAGARAQTEFFTKMFGAKKRSETAELQLALLPGADDAERITLLTRFMKQFGGSAPRDRVAVAEAELGLSLWRSACARLAPDGSCVAPRKQLVATACGKQLGGAVGVARKPAVVKQALVHLQRAQQMIAAALPGTDDDGRAEVLRQTLGWVLLARGDALLEPVRIGVDGGNGGPGTPGPAPKLGPGAAKAQEYVRWMQAMQKAVQPATELYLRVIRDSAGEARPAAAYRVAQSFAMLQQSIAQASPPKGLGPDGERAFCEELGKFELPMVEKRVEALESCVRVTREIKSVQWFERCVAELSVLDPVKWPVSEELGAPPVRGVVELPEPRRMLLGTATTP